MAIRKIERVSTNAVIEYYGEFWNLTTAGFKKRIVHDALYQGGLHWMVKFIPKRFTQYAFGLGYRVTDRWKKFKRRILKGDSLPMIGITPPGGGGGVVVKGKHIFPGKRRNAEKMAVAIERGANVKVKGTSTGGDIHIAIPYGHPLNPQTALALRKLPENETQEVVDVVARKLAEHIGQFAAQHNRAVEAGIRGGKKLVIRGSKAGFRPRASGGPPPRK